MRILTVRQPWAWAIIHGGKDVENRVRNIAGDYRGPVAIHGGLSLDAGAFGDPTLRAAWSMLRDNDLLTGGWSDRYMGAIIGVIDLVDVHESLMGCMRTPDACSEYNRCSRWAEAYSHHLVLANPRPLAEPIPYRGALWLQKPDAATEARILEAIA